jgi:hypothetical protein
VKLSQARPLPLVAAASPELAKVSHISHGDGAMFDASEGVAQVRSNVLGTDHANADVIWTMRGQLAVSAGGV